MQGGGAPRRRAKKPTTAILSPQGRGGRLGEGDELMAEPIEGPRFKDPYRKFYPRTLREPRYLEMSDRGKYLYFYLNLHPYLDRVGTLQTSPIVLADELRWSADSAKKELGELIRRRYVHYDPQARHLWLAEFLTDNYPESPNVISAWMAALARLPEGHIKDLVAAKIREVAADLGPAFVIATEYGARPHQGKPAPEVCEKVKQRDQNRCRYCAREVDWTDRKGQGGGTYDHVDPRGPSVIINLVVSCRACNARKGLRDPDQSQMPVLILSRSDPDVPDVQFGGNQAPLFDPGAGALTRSEAITGTQLPAGAPWPEPLDWIRVLLDRQTLLAIPHQLIERLEPSYSLYDPAYWHNTLARAGGQIDPAFMEAQLASMANHIRDKHRLLTLRGWRKFVADWLVREIEWRKTDGTKHHSAGNSGGQRPPAGTTLPGGTGDDAHRPGGQNGRPDYGAAAIARSRPAKL